MLRGQKGKGGSWKHFQKLEFLFLFRHCLLKRNLSGPCWGSTAQVREEDLETGLKGKVNPSCVSCPSQIPSLRESRSESPMEMQQNAQTR